MPVFRFHLHECGTVTEDEEGVSAADVAEARVLAVKAAREVMCAEVANGRLCLSCRIDVTDESGAVVLQVPFKDILTITGL